MMVNNRALMLAERTKSNDISKYSDSEFNKRTQYWTQFYYNNKTYMENSLKVISQLETEDIKFLDCENEAMYTESNFEWLGDWNLILNNSFKGCHETYIKNNKEFGTFINHFLKLAHSKIKNSLVHNKTYILAGEEYYEGIFNSLYTDLLMFCKKTLVLELNILRESSKLKGSTPNERYKYFENNILNDFNFLSNFGEEYPVLIRVMIERVNNWSNFINDITNDLEKDWPVLIEQFPELKEAGKVVKFHLGMGDTHKKGKTVTILEFENRWSIVYKPRSLDVDKKYQELLQWLNSYENNIPYFYKLRVVDIGEHGWTEYIPYESCENMSGIKNFYKRIGAQLALLYVFNATDFHYGNIIAKGEHPVLIDLESLFHQNIYEETYDEEALGQAEKMLSRSVMASGMLPNLIYQRGNQEKSGIDVSGLGGKGNQELPFEVSKTINTGTDQVHIQKGIAFLEAGQNLPSYKGEFVNLHTYLTDIEYGFTAVYRFLSSNKDLFIEQIKKFREVKLRTIVRPTAAYGELLRSITHPDLLRNGLDRDVFLHRLWLKCLGLPQLERLLVHEKNDLHCGDVPIFTTVPCEKHLWSSEGTKISNFFSKTAYDSVLQKIRNLGEKDLYEQLQVLHMVMLASNASHYADVEIINPFDLEYSLSVEKSHFLEQAIDIGDYLIKTAIEGVNGDKKDLTWISTVLEGNKEVAWKISPVGLDFYNGNSGIVLFLSYLSFLSGEKRFERVARQGLIPMLNDMKKYKENPTWSLGIYNGVGGNLFTIYQLATLWNDDSLLNEVLKALPGYKSMIKEDKIFDYIGGAAGALDLFLKIYNNTKNQDALEGAIACGNHLIQNSKQMECGGIGWSSILNSTALTGYSHGNAGIVATLSALYKLTGDKFLLSFISKALEYERSFFNKEEKNWATPQREKSSFAWCHGAPGILLSRIRLKENGYKDEYLEQEIEDSLETTLTRGFGNNRSYCHGDFGQLEILLYADKVLSNVNLRPHIDTVGSQILNLMRDKMWNYGVSRGTESKGLMTGLAGYGLGLLKQYDNERTPNILNLGK
ncbi:type 2 lanthipeptide synthetase LanM family protein [Priestia megaterium]|uniref:type 2 lanthipeptide synthetase LanM family protein n=1 Tax=Priestia megaterium TaxID=1404 RepID=UPI002E1EE80F|nr:type 2 lanthipeptide synthetase LanM family protein [Priestia megaterium]